MNDVDNMQDVLDFRDITDRVEELEDAIGAYENPDGDLESHDANLAEKEELKMLTDLLDETRGNGGDHQWRGDWYPGSLIRDSYFNTAMDELLEDIGDLPRDLPCYLRVEVDYKALQMDYTSVEFDGVTYWYR